MEMKTKGIIVELDVDSVDKAISLVVKLADHVGGFKIGLELVAAMLASVISPAYEEVHIFEANKIRQLFILLGYEAFKTLQFVSKAKGAGCEGILFTQKGLSLIGKRGEQLRGMTATGKAVKVDAGDYVVVGREITQATDPVAAAKEEEASAEPLLEQLRRMN